MNRALFRLSLRQAASSRRLALLLVLALLPIGLALLIKSTAGEDSGEAVIEAAFQGFVLLIVLPITMIVLATSTFGNEVEDRTLGLLATKPVSRLAIVLPKLAASIVVAAPLIVADAVIITAIGVEEELATAVLAAAAGSLVGIVAYASVFTWAGLVTSRALAVGIIYVFVWEGVLTGFVSGLRYMSIRGYTEGVIVGLDSGSFSALDGDVIGLPAALVGAGIATVLFAFLTVRRLNRMDIS